MKGPFSPGAAFFLYGRYRIKSLLLLAFGGFLNTFEHLKKIRK
jgi:hypothetical protein